MKIKRESFQLESVFVGHEVARKPTTIVPGTSVPIIEQIFVRIDGKRFEFTRHAGGPLEVYDFPGMTWGGLSRFCGHMKEESARKLERIISWAIAEQKIKVQASSYPWRHTG